MPAPDNIHKLVDPFEQSLHDYRPRKGRSRPAADGMIDSQVYELYNLSEEEINIVEGNPSD